MAISHLCYQCGTELARVRPDFEPAYGLPVVHCPSCGRAQVRRKHPIPVRIRQGCRIFCAFVQIAWRTSLLIWLGSIMYWMNRGLFADWSSLFRALSEPRTPQVYGNSRLAFVLEQLMPLAFWIAGAVVGGAVVAGMLAHWKRRLAWGAWLLFLVVLVSDTLFLETLRHVFEPVLPVTIVASYRSVLSAWMENVWATFLTFGVSLAGAPVGWLFIRAARNGRSRRWRKRRAKYRKRQRGE